MENHIFAIVGASGKTGARVAERLISTGHAVRPLSRQSEIAFDWADRSTWAPALRGVQSAYVTYYPDLAVPQAESDIRAFVEVARGAGIQHLVMLSGRGEDGAQRAESALMNSGLDWNVVRASWFMQNFSESFMAEGLKAGELVLPEPKAYEPFIDVEDIADVATAALTRPALRNQLLEVTGPVLLSFEECVRIMSSASKRDFKLTTLPVDAYLAGAKAQGLPDEMAWLINELFVNVLDGRNASITDTVEDVLGRPAKRFEDYAQRAAASGVWEATPAVDAAEVVA